MILINDIQWIVSTCEKKKCQLNHPQPYPEPTENISTEVEGPFYSSWTLYYIIGPLVKTSNNNQYIMVAFDYFTKWVEAEPTGKYYI